MKEYFVSAMVSIGHVVKAKNEEEAVELFFEEVSDLPGDIDGDTIYVEEEE